MPYEPNQMNLYNNYRQVLLYLNLEPDCAILILLNIRRQKNVYCCCIQFLHRLVQKVC